MCFISNARNNKLNWQFSVLSNESNIQYLEIFSTIVM